MNSFIPNSWGILDNQDPTNYSGYFGQNKYQSSVPQSYPFEDSANQNYRYPSTTPDPLKQSLVSNQNAYNLPSVPNPYHHSAYSASWHPDTTKSEVPSSPLGGFGSPHGNLGETKLLSKDDKMKSEVGVDDDNAKGRDSEGKSVPSVHDQYYGSFQYLTKEYMNGDHKSFPNHPSLMPSKLTESSLFLGKPLETSESQSPAVREEAVANPNYGLNAQMNPHFIHGMPAWSSKTFSATSTSSATSGITIGSSPSGK